MSLQDGGLQVSLTPCWVIQLGVTKPLFWAMPCAGKALGALSASALQGLTAQYLLTAGMGAIVTQGDQAGPMLCPRQDGSAKGVHFCWSDGGSRGVVVVGEVREGSTRKHRP